MAKSGMFARIFIVVGLAAAVAALATNPNPSPRMAAVKPASAHQVPVLLIDRNPPPVTVQPILVDRDPPDQCFLPRSRSNSGERVACG